LQVLAAITATHTQRWTRSPPRWGGKPPRGPPTHPITCSRFGRASGAMTPEQSTNSPAGAHDRRTGDLDEVDPACRPGGARVQPRGTADLGTLVNLDLLAPGDPAAPGQVHGQRPGSRPSGGIPSHPPPRPAGAGPPPAPPAP